VAATELNSCTIEVPEVELEDLRERLRRTRWPRREPVPDWSQGPPLDYVRGLAEYWEGRYDWRAFERRLNEFPQFRTEVDGVDLHFLHVRSRHEGALPLLLTHGWPGSIREYTDLIEPLVDPPDPADAFDVVLPSLPGFGFSGQPEDLGWDVPRIAAAWQELMARLGYRRYGAHGGDWGAPITARLAHVASEHVAGIHLTIPVVDLGAPPDPDVELSDFERRGAERAADFAATGMGYLTLQGTRPQTLGYGLADSPVGQLAWILDKFDAWTDGEDPISTLGADTILDDVTLYWLNNAGASSARLYWEGVASIPADPVEVPVGAAIFPKEHVRVPRQVAERKLTDVRRWTEQPRGGHFAALECPDVMVAELRGFFAEVR
jgi:pimeloyl-ACP methyl ester carboxylesterase